MTHKQLEDLRRYMQLECKNCPRELDSASYSRGVERVLDELENLLDRDTV